VVADQTDRKLKEDLGSWIENSHIQTTVGFSLAGALGLSSSPRYDVYGNDFRWGKPTAVRTEEWRREQVGREGYSVTRSKSFPSC
ncbi:unnamed protein product, partial [Linum tenue]